MAYATRAQVYDLGLRAEAFLARARAVEAVDAATGILTLRSNGFEDGYLLTLFVEGSATPGRPSATLPGGASASVVYEAVPVNGSSDLFRLRPVGGSRIDSFTNAGTGVFSVAPDIGRLIDRNAVSVSARIDEWLTDYAPPIKVDSITGLYPEILIRVAARMTAADTARVLGLANPIYQASLDALVASQDDDKAMLLAWFKGRYINAHPEDQTTELENAALAGRSAAPTNWRTGTL